MSESRVTILPLPCGCFADADALYVHVTPAHVVECPWCGATFLRSDFDAWLAAGESNRDGLVKTYREPGKLVRFGGKVVEVQGRCRCNALLVRERGGTCFHLDVPSCLLERVVN